MKPKNHLKLLALVAIPVALTPSIYSASATWTGATDGNWTTGANWSPAAAPTADADVATFGTSSNTTITGIPTSLLAVRFAFTDSASTSAFTIGDLSAGPGSSSTIITAASGWNVTSGASGSSLLAASQVFNPNLALGARGTGANITFTNHSTASGQLLTINSDITATNSGAGQWTVQFRGNGNKVMNGVIRDSGTTGTIVSIGGGGTNTGTTTLNGANTHTGGTTMGGGTATLVLGNKSALGTGALSFNTTTGSIISASTALTGANAIANNILFNSSVNSPVNAITGTSGNTTFTVTSASGLAVGMVVAGTGVPTGSTITNISGTTITINNALTANSSGTSYTFGYTGSLGTIGTNTFTVPANSYVTVGMNVSGVGIPINTVVTAVNGTTITVSNNLLGAATGTYFLNTYAGSGSSTVTYGGTNDMEFTGAVALTTPFSTLAAATQTFNVTNTGTTTFSGVMSQGTGVAAVTKTGTGTLVFSGANTYTGANTVNAGTLLINNTSGSGTGSGTIAVANASANGSIFGGSGSVSGLITINSGGSFRPGALGGTSTATFTSTNNTSSALTLNTGSTAFFDIQGTVKGAAVSGYDNFTTAGRVNYGGAFTINLLSVQVGAVTVYDLFDFASIDIARNFDSVTFTGLYSGTATRTGTGATGVWNLNDIDGTTLSFSQATGDLTISAVPEPSTYAVIAGLAGLAVVGFRRRRTV
jgi:autotransporter-associated beta strand protein